MPRANIPLVFLLICGTTTPAATTLCNSGNLSTVDTVANGETTRTITVSGNTDDSLSTCCNDCLSSGITHLVIQKNSNVPADTEIVWTDFMFAYGTHGDGTGTTLRIKGLTLYTSTIDGYAIYSRNTRTYLEDLTIDGYSGRGLEKNGGAMRIREADYCDDANVPSQDHPTINRVAVNNNCRGIRIQDSKCAYVFDSTATNNTDNSFYFATGAEPYSSDFEYGCKSSTFDKCTATNSGQAGFMLIGGENLTVVDSTVSGSRGAGVMIYYVNSEVTLDTISFTNANTHHTRTPWGDTTATPPTGSTDDASGASLGVSVASTDTDALITCKHLEFNSGGVLDHGSSDDSIVVHNDDCHANVTFSIAHTSIYEPSEYAVPPYDSECILGTGLQEATTTTTPLTTTTRAYLQLNDDHERLTRTRANLQLNDNHERLTRTTGETVGLVAGGVGTLGLGVWFAVLLCA